MTYLIGSTVNHPSFGNGVIVHIEDSFYHIYFNGAIKEIAVSFDDLEPIVAIESAESNVGLDDIEDALENVLYKNGFFDQPIKMGDKWERGKVVLHSHDEALQPKEIPMETFFKKITSVREKLRVLEQNINNHEKLSEEDKFHLQQYISRAYGSLTTFNVLFKYKDDQFSSK